MSSEFDEINEAAALPPPAATDAATHRGTPVSRLVARLFAAAGNPLRVRLLRCLMRPLGLLGVAGVASGAFVAFVDRSGGEAQIDVEAVGQVSSQQMLELAHFVEQVDPLALERFASLAASSPLVMATFSASVLLLLYRRLRLTPAFKPPA